MRPRRVGWSGWLPALASAGGVAAVAVLDFATGAELGFFLFYLLPIAVATWFGWRGMGLSAAILSTVVWWCVDQLGGRDAGATVVQAWNALIRFGAFVVVVTLISAVRRLNATLEEKVAERTARVRQLAAEVTSAEARERDRVARLLHDDLQQQLHAVQFQLVDLRDHARAGRARDIEQEVERLLASLREASSTTRTLAAELSPAALQRTEFSSAIRWLADRFRDQYGLAVAVEASPDITLRALGSRHLLFSLVRECLFNIVKHAGVDDARVTMRHVDGRLVIAVEDEGRGFDTSTLEGEVGAGTGLGLRGAAERLELVGGTLHIDSGSDRGTRITMSMPSAL